MSVAEYVRQWLPGDFGYACDVGANDGELLSNSKFYEDLGWYVLCIEPNPIYENRGRACRKLWREVAAGAEDREATFTDVSGASYSTIDSDRPGVQSQVQMYRLDRLLEEAGFPRLDYLTVDVEGYEPKVFEGFTPERWNTRVIVAEAWTETEEARIILPGYTKVHTHEFDRIYVRNDLLG